MQSWRHAVPPLFSLSHNVSTLIPLTRRTTRRCGPVASLAALNGEQDHYAVLGLSPRATPLEVKRAYRLLARECHPDVCKDLKASETFKSIRQAYEVLSDERTRAVYDENIRLHDSSKAYAENYGYDTKYDEGVGQHFWNELIWRLYKNMQDYDTSDDEIKMEERISSHERGSFFDVVKSAYIMWFFRWTLGARVALTFCCFAALLDKHLDAGYKLGFLTAWVLGGQRGVWLSLSLSFISWLCGKTSSSKVAVVLVAIWVATNLTRFTPFPPGAVLTMLYMSIKLQLDIS